MELKVCTASHDRELIHEVDRVHHDGWPEFMTKDKIADRYWGMLMTVFSDFQVLLLNENNDVVAVGNSIPIHWDGTVEGLPSGWDDAFERGALGHMNGVQPNTLSALAIVVDPEFRGRGISSTAIRAMKNVAKEKGLNSLIVPLRPSMKSEYPLTPIERYIEWTDEDGLPFDPWLRTHRKLDGEVLRIAHESMVITGTVAEWESWTQKKFPDDGDYIVRGALTPIKIDHQDNTGCYIEPNVWVRHGV